MSSEKLLINPISLMESRIINFNHNDEEVFYLFGGFSIAVQKKDFLNCAYLRFENGEELPLFAEGRALKNISKLRKLKPSFEKTESFSPPDSFYNVNGHTVKFTGNWNYENVGEDQILALAHSKLDTLFDERLVNIENCLNFSKTDYRFSMDEFNCSKKNVLKNGNFQESVLKNSFLTWMIQDRLSDFIESVNSDITYIKSGIVKTKPCFSLDFIEDRLDSLKLYLSEWQNEYLSLQNHADLLEDSSSELRSARLLVRNTFI